MGRVLSSPPHLVKKITLKKIKNNYNHDNSTKNKENVQNECKYKLSVGLILEKQGMRVIYAKKPKKVQEQGTTMKSYP